MRKLTHEEIAGARLSQEELLRVERTPLFVLLDNVRSLYNVGSIFRTADGSRISKLILTGYTPYPPRKEIEKTALGATQSVPWEYVKDPQAAIMQLRNGGVRICALEQTDMSISYDKITHDNFPLCLILGNEITGVSEDLLALADMSIQIPMLGIKHSLNVAVAAGIAMYELMRIWRNGQ